MPFTKLSASAAAIGRTKHTELVAMLGANKKGQNIRVAVIGDNLIFSACDGYAYDTTSTWTWGATTDKPNAARKGAFFAAAGELAITDNGESFTSWRGTKRLATIKHPDFGLSVAVGQMIHGKLVLAAEKAGVVVVDPASGKTLRVIDKFEPKLPADHPEAFDDTCSHWLGEAPDNGILVSDGDAITVYDLQTGKRRAIVEAPKGLEVRMSNMTPDGRFLVTQTVSKAKWTVGVTGFAVFDMTKSKWVKLIVGNRPSNCEAAFVDGGKLLAVTLTKPAVELYEVGSWKKLDTLDFSRTKDGIDTVIPWNARGAMVLTGEKGTAYVFLVGSGAIAKAAVTADATSRDLYFMAGTSNKVWRANLDGATYTAQWGRRGGALTAKTFTLASAADAKQAFDKAVAEKLRKGYKDATG